MKHSILSRLQKLESFVLDNAPSPPIIILFSTDPEPEHIPEDAHIIRFKVNDAIGEVKITRGKRRV